ncbi:NCA2-domain-containing protein [Ramicandelaber brevisporus]|nr:NCA2-domain-containing protein [Ramicandelaber brevisporus]
MLPLPTFAAARYASLLRELTSAVDLSASVARDETTERANALISSVSDSSADFAAGTGEAEDIARIVSSLPALSQVMADIRQSTAVLSKNPSSPSALIVFASAVYALSAHAIDRMVGVDDQLERDIEYWRARLAYPTSVALHGVETAPIRLANRTVSLVRSTSIAEISQQLRSIDVKGMKPGELAQELVKAPKQAYRNIHAEIQSNIHVLSSTRSGNARLIGEMMNWHIQKPLKVDSVLQLLTQASHFAVTDQHSSKAISLSEATSVSEALVQRLKANQPFPDEVVAALPPAGITRLWLPALTFALVARSAVRWMFAHEASIQTWIRESVQTMQLFVQDWVYEPLLQVWNTVRHRERRLAIMGADSLSSDLDSLERMVADFVKNTSAKAGDAATDSASIWTAELSERVRNGDLSPVMRVYEREMSNPVRSALFGQLLQAVLIQVQKTKVDLELAMAALDQLLRANELNFAFLAMLPSVAALLFGVRYVRRLLRQISATGPQKAVVALRTALREIDVILADAASEKQTLSTIDNGRLVCRTHTIRVRAREFIAAGDIARAFGTLAAVGGVPLASIGQDEQRYQRWLCKDIADLENSSLPIAQRQQVLQRFYRSYPFLISM